MSIFNSIGHLFQDVAHALAKAFGFLSSDKVKTALAESTTAVQYAVPIVQLIAGVTGNQIPAVVAAVLQDLAIPAEKIFAEAVTSVDEIFRDGGRLRIAAELLRKNFLKEVAQGGKIHYGDVFLTTAEQIIGLDKVDLETIIQNAVKIFRKGQAKPAL